jgi:hypothetical protein
VLEKFIIGILVFHFIFTALAVVSIIVSKLKLKKELTFEVKLKGIFGCLGVVAILFVMVVIAGWLGWMSLAHVIGILAIPYSLISIFFASNSFTLAKLREAGEDMNLL